MFSVNQVYSNANQTVRLRICHVSIELAKLSTVDLNRLQSKKTIGKPKNFQFDDFASHIKKHKLSPSIEML